MFLRIFNEFCAGVQIPFPPRCDHLDIGFQGVVAKFEPHLIIAFASRPVGHGIRPHLFGDLDLAFGNERPGN